MNHNQLRRFVGVTDMCVLMWDEKQVTNLAKTEFGVMVNSQYVQQLVQGLHQRGVHMTDAEYESRLTTELVLGVLENDIGRKPKRSQDDIQTDAGLDT